MSNFDELDEVGRMRYQVERDHMLIHELERLSGQAVDRGLIQLSGNSYEEDASRGEWQIQAQGETKWFSLEGAKEHLQKLLNR